MEKEVIREVGKKANNVNSQAKKRKNLNTKRIDLKINSDEEVESVLDFYNLKIKKIHIITFIVILVLFLITFVAVFSGKTGAMASTTPNTFKEQLNVTFFYSIATILAGIVPYFYLSFGGVSQLLSVIGDFGARYTLGRSFAVSIFLGGVINCIGVALCMAVGFYYCYLTTKKRKYYNASQFTMEDVKLQLYELRNQKDKVNEILKKKEKRAKEIEKCNVKIPYVKFCVLGLVAYIIQIFGILIAKI